MNRCFLVYVTANDVIFYQDYVNLFLSRFRKPGVPQIELYVVVSEVKPFTWWDKCMLRIILRMADTSKHLQCKALILKSNLGRDFSSVYHALQVIKDDVGPDDYVMVRNRSTRGPHAEGWFKTYIDLLESGPDMALIGSTIGFRDHPRLRRMQDILHVQTYVYLSRWRHLSALLPSFPGIRATTHHEAIMDGEIDLSQQIIRNGGSIGCLQFPSLSFTAENQNQYFDYAGKQNELGRRVGPIVKRPHINPWTYYLQILPILTTVIFYIFPMKRKYSTITSDLTRISNTQHKA